MKRNHINIAVLLILAIFAACKKSDMYREPDSSDKTKPGIVTNVTVKNYNGAAVVSYSLPNDPNLLYVQADYTIRNGVSRQTKSSYFLDTLRLDGFARSQVYTVTLRTVTRANVQSDPVTITVHPDTPYYQLVAKSIKLAADFGGMNIKVTNAGKLPIAVNTLNIDAVTKKFVIADQHYTSTDSINYSIRGYKSNPTKFGVYITDRFGNVSDTSIVTLTPLYEELLDHTQFFNYPLPSDAYIGYGNTVPHLFDGFTTEDNGAGAWQTTVGPTPALLQCTFGLGRTYKLSHFLMYLRGYGYDNPKDFTIYGSNVDHPADAVTPGGVTPGTKIGDWVALGTYHVPDPPSGLPQGQTNAADQAFLNAGVDYSVPFDSPASKYIRVVVTDTWFGLNYTTIREMTFYGSPN